MDRARTQKYVHVVSSGFNQLRLVRHPAVHVEQLAPTRVPPTSLLTNARVNQAALMRTATRVITTTIIIIARGRYSQIKFPQRIHNILLCTHN